MEDDILELEAEEILEDYDDDKNFDIVIEQAIYLSQQFSQIFGL